MPGAISYRTAKDGDQVDILRVIRASFAEYQGKLDPPSSAHHKTPEDVQNELSRATAILAVAGTEAVGCVFYRATGNYVYLYRLAVVPNWRKHGIGSKLVNLVEEQTVNQGLHTVRLSVRVALVDNQIYYEKLGYTFKEYGTHTGYTEPTFMVLEKQLLR